MRICVLVAICVSLLPAEKTDHPTGNRTTTPTLNVVTPRGVSRGTTVEMTIEGLNLAKASAIHFSEPGIKAQILRVKELPDLPDIRLGSAGTPSTIDLGPLPPRNQVTVELDVSPEAEIGPVDFRIQTPLGTSPEGRFLIEPYYGESPDNEPDDTPENAFEAYLPTILVGAISKPGDTDLFKIRAKAGEEVVFENGAALLGSTLEPVITILREDQSIVREYGAERAVHAHRFEQAGTYYIRVADNQQSGRASHFYRIKVGTFPVALSAFPLGLEKGKTATISVRGYQLGGGKLEVKGTPSPEDENAAIVRPEGPAGASFHPLKLALGSEPEKTSDGKNVLVPVPVTMNGTLAAPGAEHTYRFPARRGQHLVLEVNARRLGSELDSFLEVSDSEGKPIERAVARAVLETSLVLNDRDSAGRGFRIQSWNGFNVGDFFLVGGEIVRAEAMPRTPDDDILVEAFGGQRLTYFDTSAEAHAVDSAFYKVQIHPPGARLAPNGLPQVKLYYRNDDGGPGYGKDSLVHFTAPADGEYLVRLRDVRGLGGDDYAYRLTIRNPTPDYRVSVSPRNPNVPAGGCVPLNVTAFRMDGFDGPIEVSLPGLPAGLHATKGVIGPGQVSTTILLSADENAKLEVAVPLRVSAAARIGGRTVTHAANPEDRTKLIALAPKPDLLMSAETREVVLEPGKTAQVTVSIERQNGFGGRVPVEVRNLPPRVRVLDVGLNGVLLNEDESRRSFTLEALPNAEPVEQLIFVSGAIETRSPMQNSYAAAQPIMLRVKPGTAALAVPSSSGAR